MKNDQLNNILDKIRKGDETPIFELYQLHRDEFLAWSKNTYEATADQAKDAFQDAIIDFHQNVMTGQLIELSSSIKTYLFQIGKHKLLNIQKKESRITYHESFQLIDTKEIERYMEEESHLYSQEQISAAIENVPADCQKVLKLFYFEEYDMDSIARELNYKNADTAKSKKSLCMNKLIEELNKIKTVKV